MSDHSFHVGDRVRIIGLHPAHIPFRAVGRTATVTAINREGGVYVREEEDPLARYYVPPAEVARCLEKLP